MVSGFRLCGSAASAASLGSTSSAEQLPLGNACLGPTRRRSAPFSRGCLFGCLKKGSNKEKPSFWGFPWFAASPFRGVFPHSLFGVGLNQRNADSNHPVRRKFLQVHSSTRRLCASNSLGSLHPVSARKITTIQLKDQGFTWVEGVFLENQPKRGSGSQKDRPTLTAQPIGQGAAAFAAAHPWSERGPGSAPHLRLSPVRAQELRNWEAASAGEFISRSLVNRFTGSVAVFR